jgi:hypothetical protein
MRCSKNGGSTHHNYELDVELACGSQTPEKSFIRIFETKAGETIRHRCRECILIRHWDRQEVDHGPLQFVWIEFRLMIGLVNNELLETEGRNRSCWPPLDRWRSHRRGWPEIIIWITSRGSRGGWVEVVARIRVGHFEILSLTFLSATFILLRSEFALWERVPPWPTIVANALYFPFWTIHRVARKQCWSKAQERHCTNRLYPEINQSRVQTFNFVIS